MAETVEDVSQPLPETSLSQREDIIADECTYRIHRSTTNPSKNSANDQNPRFSRQPATEVPKGEYKA